MRCTPIVTPIDFFFFLFINSFYSFLVTNSINTTVLCLFSILLVSCFFFSLTFP